MKQVVFAVFLLAMASLTGCLHEDETNNTEEKELVKGCMDMDATNYNLAAEIDDDSCEYPPVGGCMDMDAINYDSEAEVDDASCEYPEEECELVPYGHCSGEDLSGQDLSELNLTEIDLSSPRERRLSIFPVEGGHGRQLRLGFALCG